MGEITRTGQRDLSVLLVTGIAGDAEQMWTVFGPVQPTGVELRLAGTLSSALAVLKVEWYDLVLLDVKLPDSDGTQTLRKARTAAGDIPILVIGDGYDPAWESTIVEKEAQGYLARNEIQRFLPQIVRISIERTRVRREVVAAQQSMEQLVAEAQDAILVLDQLQTIRFANPVARRLFGVESHSLVGQPFGYPITGGEAAELDILGLDIPFPASTAR